jgi:hypothetical protein
MRLQACVAALLLSMSVVRAAVEPMRLRVGDAFPPVEGEFLTGRTAALPAAASGRLAVLLMGFTYASRQPVEEWGAWFRKTNGANPDVTFFEMPMIGGIARLGRWFIDSGMRRGTPADLHEHVITVYSKTGDWKTRLGVSDANDRDAFVIVLDREGVIRWLYHGAFTEARAQEVADLLAQFQP